MLGPLLGNHGQFRIGQTFVDPRPVLDQLSVSSAAAYSLRKLRTAYAGSAIRVRRSSDNVEADVGFTATGALDINALLNHCQTPLRPLDAVTGSAAAYSTRLLRTPYTGPLLRVRRSNDNAEQDIGFTTSGDLDTTALLAFTGSSSGFVTTWYDQSGNGWDVTQATAVSQPRIVNAGVLDTLNGRPSALFDGANDILFRTSSIGLYDAGASTVVSVFSGSSQTDRRIVAEGWGGGPNPLYSPFQSHATTGTSSSGFIRNDAGSISFANSSTLAASVFNGTATILSHVDTGSSISGFLNGTAGSTISYTRSGSLTLDRFAIGGLQRNTVTSFFSGSLPEVIIYPTDLTTANRELIERSQAAYYGITHASPVSGFVTTWYDQSGNSRNATQTVAANQPRIVNAGVVETIGGKPSIYMNGAKFLDVSLGSTVATGLHYNLAYRLSVFQDAHMFSLNGPTAFLNDGNRAGARLSIRNDSLASLADTTGIRDANPHIAGWGWNGTTAQRYFDGVASGGSGSIGGTLTLSTLRIGFNQATLDAWQSEAVFFETALSTADRQLLERNQGTFYGITVS